MDLFDLRIIGVATVVVLVIGGLSSFDISSLSTVSGQNKVNLQANSDWTAYNDYYEEAEIYGHTVDMEITGAKDPETQDVARLIFDGEEILLDSYEQYREDGIVISDVRPSGEWFRDDGTYVTVDYSVGIDVPDEDFTVELSSVSVEKTGPGERLVEYNLTIENNWHDLKVGSVHADVAGNRVELLNDGLLPKGTTEFTVVDTLSEYDESKFKVEKEVNKSTKVVIQNPSIPAAKKRIWGDKGSKTPDFNLENIETEPVSFEVDYRFCGEEATYQDGECVIEEDLHLRGDTCFLPQNYTIVTETFSPGTYDRNDVAPDPSYFCSRHPVIVTASGVQTDRITSPYQKLVEDKSFSVPEGQTYTMFWVVNANSVDVTRVCEEGTLNKTTGDCVVTPSVVHRCSSGVWSPEAGSCVVTPSAQAVCEKGRYNKELGVCVFNPEVKERCPAGSTMGEGGQCYSQASVKKVCPENVNGTLSGGRCVTDATLVVRDSPWSSFRVFVLDLQNWVEDSFVENLPSLG
ncbi:hypothetical protein [Haloferax sp. Q22]|uniref:hypothetical protein n=1 Tax=Haloferax sp. (strain Q22) TaxID=1526048 RepID=UPI000B0A4ADB|nr:hypothetical protein [Haloferax sp. Q22]